ncbi:hypothetical protein [Amycolatopsis eburnea]|uniref:Uncharacterized protein n=1 Tax=Amycolatopsis eburnea TaxID=2267691 RepID=A0A427THI9_9PSEU|nr:hypothetical protein [Amycolatopsis eburnea]RSD22897.1 hypothetical protein EIY87_07020 [Amycolatopsis eburnea]
MTRGKAAAVSAGVAVLVAAFAIGPFALFTGAVWGLVAGCRRYTRRFAGGGSGLKYHLAAFGVLYLVPVGVAATAYLGLSAYLRWFADTSGTGWLISLQRFFEAVSKFFSEHLKLSEFSVFAALIGVYLLTCLLLARRSDGWRGRAAAGLGRGADFYTKYSGPAAAGLATLASLSLFGMQLGVPATDLQVKFKIAQQGYADVTRKIEADLTQRVAGKLYGKVEASLPQAYRDALAVRRTDLAGVAEAARSSAERAKSGYDVAVPVVDEALRAEALGRQRADALAPEVRVDGAGAREAPPGITPEQVAAAEAAVGARPAEPGIDLVADGRKKVSLQVEKVATERILAVTKPVTEAVPILEPLVQAFAEAADKTLQDRLSPLYDRLAEIAVRSPRDFAAAVDREAAGLVDRTDVSRPVAAAAPRAEEAARAFQASVSALRAAPGQLDQKVTEVIQARTPPPVLDPSGRLRLTFPEIPPLRLTPPDYFRLPYSYDPGRYSSTLPDRFTVPPETARVPRIAPPPRVSPRIFFW